MHRLKGRRSRVLRVGAAALGLVALLASLGLLTHPNGRASAASYAGPTVSVVHGCDTGNGEWVEATLHSGAQVIDPSQPDIVQIGLAVSKSNTDTYLDDSGPVLVNFTGQDQVVRLSGPIKGAHVFIRQYGDTAYVNTPVPATCTHAEETDFGGLATPQISRTGDSVSCLSSDATLPVTVWNDGDVDADYTVLLVGGKSGGQLVGSNTQGWPVSVKAHAKATVLVAQPYQSVTTVYQFQARVLGIDGTGNTAGSRPVQCDSQGHRGPQPTKTPILPTKVPTASVSNSPSSHAPSTSASPGKPSHSKPASSPAKSSQSAPVVRTSASSSPANPGNGGNVDGNSGGGNAVVTSADTGGPVLGDADSTTQAAPTKASTSAPKKIVVGAAGLQYGVSPSFALGGLLILLAFGAALAGMLAASRASARRR